MNKFFSILFISYLSISCSGFSSSITAISNNMNSNKLESKSAGLENTTINWFFIPNNEFRTPKINNKLNFKLSDYDTIYNGPTSSKCKSLYLTFD